MGERAENSLSQIESNWPHGPNNNIRCHSEMFWRTDHSSSISTASIGLPLPNLEKVSSIRARAGWVAQLVEQRTENPCVGGSIPPPATMPKVARVPLLSS